MANADDPCRSEGTNRCALPSAWAEKSLKMEPTERSICHQHDLCLEMRLDFCPAIRIDTCVDMCIGMCTYMHVSDKVPRTVASLSSSRF